MMKSPNVEKRLVDQPQVNRTGLPSDQQPIKPSRTGFLDKKKFDAALDEKVKSDDVKVRETQPIEKGSERPGRLGKRLDLGSKSGRSKLGRKVMGKLKVAKQEADQVQHAIENLAEELNIELVSAKKIAVQVAEIAAPFIRHHQKATVRRAGAADLEAGLEQGVQLPDGATALVMEEPATGRAILVVLDQGTARVALLADGELPETQRVAERAFRAQAKLKLARELFARNLSDRARDLYEEASMVVKDIERNVTLHQRKQLHSSVESVGTMLRLHAA